VESASKPLKIVRNCISANPKFSFFWRKEDTRIPQTHACGARERPLVTCGKSGFRVLPTPPHCQTPGFVTDLHAMRRSRSYSTINIVMKRYCSKTHYHNVAFLLVDNLVFLLAFGIVRHDVMKILMTSLPRLANDFVTIL